MSKGIAISSKEKRFFNNVARTYPATITSRDKTYILHEHRKTFKIRRTEAAISAQIHLAKKRVGITSELKSKRANSIFELIECSKVKASPLENILIDLADEIKALCRENEELKRRLAEKDERGKESKIESSDKQIQKVG